MPGDARIRHCGACGQDVVNLSALTREAALRAIDRPDPPCVRIGLDRTGCPIHRRARLATLGLLLSGQALAAPAVPSDEDWFAWAARRVQEWWNPPPAPPPAPIVQPRRRDFVGGDPGFDARPPPDIGPLPDVARYPLSVIFSPQDLPFRSLEVVCPGFGQEVPFVNGVATASITIDSRCRVIFEGAPSMGAKLMPGAHACSVVGNQVDCSEALQSR